MTCFFTFQSTCVEFISDHPDAITNPSFCDLTESLRNDILEMLSWGQRAMQRDGVQAMMGPTPAGFNTLADLTANLRLSSNVRIMLIFGRLKGDLQYVALLRK